MSEERGVAGAVWWSRSTVWQYHELHAAQASDASEKVLAFAYAHSCSRQPLINREESGIRRRVSLLW